MLAPRAAAPEKEPVVADTLPETRREPQVPATEMPETADRFAASATATKEAPVKKNTCPEPSDPKQDDKWLLAVGPETSAGRDYVPVHLVPLASYVTTSKPMCLNASAAVRMQQMTAAMRKEKLSVVVSSAYRPASYQEDLREASEQKRDTAKNPYPLVALPGHSEHQLGMAADLVAGPRYTLDDFASTPEYAWLAEHAWEYGFVQSYPAGSEPVTGYSAESWHWRYVGLVHAKSIRDQGVTAYEYLKNLAEAQTKNP